MISRIETTRNLWQKCFFSLLALLLWMPTTSDAVTVWKFVAAQQYGLNVRGFYDQYNMAPSGVISGPGGTPQIHVFPYNPIQIASYNSIFGKYVIMGREPLSNGAGAYDPANDQSVTNSFQLGPKVALGYTQSGQSAFFRTINVIPAPEITVRNQASQNVVSGASVPFGNTEIGTEKTLTYQIVNTGSKPLTGIVVSIVEPHDYTVTPPAVTTLAAGAGTTFTIKFRPTGAGNRTSWIRIASNDADENPFNLTLTGTATGVVNRSIQILNQSGQPLANGSGVQDFGDASVQKTVSRNLTISNSGNVSLSNITVSLSGAHASDFSVTALSSGTLAVGTTMPLKISFTPTLPGIRSATISVGSNASMNNPYTFQITGSATGAITFDSWVLGTTLVGEDAEPSAMPFGDGVPNLLKYAFNLDPNGPDFRRLTEGAGTAGLPVFTLSQAGPNNIMKIEYLRRKNSGLIYTPKRSESLAAGSFTPITMPPPMISSIDGEWERVVMQVTAPVSQPAGFYLVEVTKP